MQPSPAAAPVPLSLAGTWRLALDRDDLGLGSGWFARPLPPSLTAALPGSLAVQRIGDDVTADTAWTATIFDRTFLDSPATARYRQPGNFKLPFWLQPEKIYVGVAWYQREIAIPDAWRGRRLTLTLERAHWQARAWLDDRGLGTGDSLSVPHTFELGSDVPPGPHRLTLRVDNRVHLAVGENAHSVSDHTQGNWNGVIGRLELAATDSAWIDDVQVFPHVATRSITVRGLVRTAAGTPLPPSVDLAVAALNVSASAPLAPDGTFTTTLALGPTAALWDEFTPTLHRLTVSLPSLSSQPSALSSAPRSVAVGLREIATAGTQFTLNGRPLFLRGTLDCCIFPRTGHPPMDVDAWLAILRTIQSHGLNHVRFHSWCPPEAAFIAGDKLGLYFQIDGPVWSNAMAVLGFNSPAGIGDGAPVDAWLLAESERIIRAYGNHPCFVLMASGNEPGGPQHREYLSRWLTRMRALDPRRLYTGAAGWPELPENQFHEIPEPRLHQWGDGLKSRLNAQPPATTADYRDSVARRTVPVIAHEIGQWCAYPPIQDTAKFIGHLRPHAYEICADSLAASGLAAQLPDFVRASGKLQALCYKEEIESALRTPGFGGFQLLGLQDFPGQGTAPVGVLDAFWESKGAIAPASFRRFCNATVPLAHLAKRIFTTDESLEADLEVAHYGPRPRAIAAVAWRLVNDAGHTLLAGRLPARPLKLGAPNLFGRVAIPLRSLAAPAPLRFVVRLEGTEFENDWEIWVYPATPDTSAPASLRLTSSLDAAESALATGGTVVLSLPPAAVRGDVALGFTPIFWNTWCTQRQAPHTLGLLCDPAHPALADFPTDAHTNWQWWPLITRAAAMVLDDLPPTLRPIVQVIDDWFTNRRLGLVFEARVGPGRLLVSSIDLETGLAADPVVCQFRTSLLRYATGPAFAPAVEVSFARVRALSKPQTVLPTTDEHG